MYFGACFHVSLRGVCCIGRIYEYFIFYFRYKHGVSDK